MNKIYFGDNLPILQEMESESVDLIYIDPPFNTGKVQKRTTIKTVQSDTGSRKGFQGKNYETVELGTKSYADSFDSLVEFLRPRLIEAHRILKSNGSLYFHIDYREVHYCKILLDDIFGSRECFMNEIIWAYDYGGRAKSKWPAKHDNILFYVKDPQKYIFNTHDMDREPYMAPGLVGPEKAEKGKLPTDTWWPAYVGFGEADTWYSGFIPDHPTDDNWWMTIVPTNGKERIGYPTQKPKKLVDRIVKASSLPGATVLDFFAGSGTVGASCIDLGRNFVLIDKNQASLEVMAKRFGNISDIKWIGFDPTPFVENIVGEVKQEILSEVKRKYTSEFEMLVATASFLKEGLQEKSDLWKGSQFEWLLQLPARQKGTLGGRLVASWCAGKGLSTERSKEPGENLIINGHKIAIKFSTLWSNGKYKFQQIRKSGYDYVLCFGISPNEAHCWVFDREYAIKNATPQHKGEKGAEYWIDINLKHPPKWIKGCGGSLDEAYQVLRNLKPKQKSI
jgi:site-specific DNA-methyltransferase (adenine-specific)